MASMEIHLQLQLHTAYGEISIQTFTCTTELTGKELQHGLGMPDRLRDLGKVRDDPRYLLSHGLRHFHHTQSYSLDAQLTSVLVHHSQLQCADELEKSRLNHYGNRWGTACICSLEE